MSSYSFANLEKLEGDRLFLAPVTEGELEGTALALISEITWFSKTRKINSIAAFKNYFSSIFERQRNGSCLPLLVRLKESGEIVGLSSYQYPTPNFRKVEIGFTWIADKWQRTFVNTEMKFLMLTHAFEEMKTNRVEFSVHPQNEKSNLAVRRIGATFEGMMRKWRFLPGTDDGNRNIYSIIDDEWPRVREHLKKLLNARGESCSR